MDPVLIGELLAALMFFGVIGFLLIGFPVAFTLAVTTGISGILDILRQVGALKYLRIDWLQRNPTLELQGNAKRVLVRW